MAKKLKFNVSVKGKFVQNKDVFFNPKSIIVYRNSVGQNLGDHWLFLNFCLKKSVELGGTIYINNVSRRLFGEIVPLFDIGKLVIVDDVSGADVVDLWYKECLCRYLPVRSDLRWRFGLYNRISYQIYGHGNQHLKAPRGDAVLLQNIPGEKVLLGGDVSVSIEENVRRASRTDVFVGIDSGFAHVMHSVGLPVFLVQYGFSVNKWHRDNPYILCNGMSDAVGKVLGYYSSVK